MSATWGTALKNKKTKKLTEVELHDSADEAFWVRDHNYTERGFKIVLVKIKEVK